MAKFINNLTNYLKPGSNLKDDFLTTQETSKIKEILI
jgi:hypothetical protein